MRFLIKLCQTIQIQRISRSKKVNWNKITGIILIAFALVGAAYVLLFDKESSETLKVAFISFVAIIVGKGVDLLRKKEE